MARSKKTRSPRRGASKSGQTSSPSAPTQEPQAAAQDSGQSPQPVKKGVYLSALVYVEGMQAPADDFAALAKDAFSEALSGQHKGLSITLKSAQVENNAEDNSSQSASASTKKGGFDF